MKSNIITLLLLCALPLYAQEAGEADVVNLRVEGRGDYDTEFLRGGKMDEESGFRGKYLNVKLAGEFAGKFSYGYRQRMNKFSKDMHFFDATDWLYLSYRPIPSLTVTAGKQVVGIGGYEYDRAPIDLYFCSEFWNNTGCYAWGVSAAYDFKRGHDRLFVQVSQSLFDTHGTDLYAYNLMWYGHHAWWQTMWSLNAIQTAPGRYISYAALGNQFTLSKHWNVQLDLMNRAGLHQRWLFGDFSVMGELNYHPNSHLHLFAKGTFDYNDTHNDADHVVMAGTQIKRVGLGLEYQPLKGKYNDWVRLHATYCYSWGKNGNPNGVLLNDQHVLNVGLTCRVDVFKLKGK